MIVGALLFGECQSRRESVPMKLQDGLSGAELYRLERMRCLWLEQHARAADAQQALLAHWVKTNGGEDDTIAPILARDVAPGTAALRVGQGAAR